jgi:hypothetical protein
MGKPELKIVSSNTIEDVAKYDLVYLATPYSKYKKGVDEAFKDAARLTGRLLKMGVKVYSPICHTHPIAIYSLIDPLDHSIWLPFDEAIMAKADAMLVAKMEGWSMSRGIQHEMGFFGAAEKPIYYLDIDTFEVRR